MNADHLIRTYLSGLEKGDSNEILQIFSENAVVVSPLYGRIKARDFYLELFEDTRASRTTLKDIYYSSSVKHRLAAHFIYDWRMTNGRDVRFECIDLFELDESSGKIDKLTIIYDSRQARHAWSQLKGDGKRGKEKPA